MFVADSGMNSEDNRAELAKACGKYLLACPMARLSEVKREVLGKCGRYSKFKDNLYAKEVIVGDGDVLTKLKSLKMKAPLRIIHLKETA